MYYNYIVQDIIIHKLVWDAWNIAHIAEHDVIPEEAEEVCKDKPQTEIANKGRIRVTGLTKNGRLLSVFLDSEPGEGVYYPVSARSASKKERGEYRSWRKGG